MQGFLVWDPERQENSSLSIKNNDFKCKVKSICIQGGFICLLTDLGEIIQYGEAPGKNALKKSSQDVERIFESQYSILKEISGSKVKQVACNQTAIFALTSNGEIYSWGVDLKKTGVLGQGEQFSSLSPTRIGPQIRFKFISVSSKHASALDFYGNLYQWGSGVDGELGVPEETLLVPTRIFSKIVIGGKKTESKNTATLVLTSGGHVFIYGKLGQGSPESTDKPKYEPKVSEELRNEFIAEAQLGNGFAVVLEKKGQCFVILENMYSQRIKQPRAFCSILTLDKKIFAITDQSHLFEYEIFGTPLMYHPKLTMGYTDWYQLVRSCKIQDSYTSPTFLQSSYNSHIIIEYTSKDIPEKIETKGSPRASFLGTSLVVEKLLNTSFSEPVNGLNAHIRDASADLCKKIAQIQTTKQSNKSVERCGGRSEFKDTAVKSLPPLSRCISPKSNNLEPPTKGEKSGNPSPITSRDNKEHKASCIEKETILSLLPSTTISNRNEKTKDRISKLGQKLRDGPSTLRSRRDQPEEYNRRVASCLSPDSMNEEELTGLICIDIENNPMTKLLEQQRDPHWKKSVTTRSFTPTIRSFQREREVEKEREFEQNDFAETSSLYLTSKTSRMQPNEYVATSETRRQIDQNLLSHRQKSANEGEKRSIMISADFNDLLTDRADALSFKPVNTLPSDFTQTEDATLTNRRGYPFTDRSLLFPLKELTISDNNSTQKPENLQSMFESLNINTLKTPNIPKRIWENKENIKEELSLAPTKKDGNDLLSSGKGGVLSEETPNRAVVLHAEVQLEEVQSKVQSNKQLPEKFAELLHISPIKKKPITQSRSNLKENLSAITSENLFKQDTIKSQTNSESKGNRIEALRDKLQNMQTMRSKSQLAEKKISQASSMIVNQHETLQEESKEKVAENIAPQLSREVESRQPEKETAKEYFTESEHNIIQVQPVIVDSLNTSAKRAASFQDNDLDTKPEKCSANEESHQSHVSQRSINQNRFDSIREKLNALSSRSSQVGEEITVDQTSEKRAKENPLRERIANISHALTEKNKSFSGETNNSVRNKENNATVGHKDILRRLEKDVTPAKFEKIEKINKIENGSSVDRSKSFPTEQQQMFKGDESSRHEKSESSNNTSISLPSKVDLRDFFGNEARNERYGKILAEEDISITETVIQRSVTPTSFKRFKEGALVFVSTSDKALEQTDRIALKVPSVLQRTAISESRPQTKKKIKSMTFNSGHESSENTLYFDDNHEKNLHYQYNNLREKLESTQVALGLSKCENIHKRVLREVFRVFKLPLEQAKEEEKIAASARCLVTLMDNLYTKREMKNLHFALNQLKNLCISKQRDSYKLRKEKEANLALGLAKLEFIQKKTLFMLKKASLEAIKQQLRQHERKIEKLKLMLELIEKWKAHHNLELAVFVFEKLTQNLVFQRAQQELFEKRALIFCKLCERSRKRYLRAGLSAFCKNSYYTNRIIMALEYTNQVVTRTRKSHLQFAWDQIQSEIWERNQRAVQIANTTFNVLRNYYLKTCSFWFSRMKQHILEKEIRYRNLLVENDSFVVYALSSVFVKVKQDAFDKLKSLAPKEEDEPMSFSRRCLYSDEVRLRLFGIHTTLGHILKRQKQTAFQKIVMSTAQVEKDDKAVKLTEAGLKKIAAAVKNYERRSQREFFLVLKQIVSEMLEAEASERVKHQQEDSQRRLAAHLLMKILATARIRCVTRAFEDLKNFGIFNIKVRSQLSAISKLSIQLELTYQNKLRSCFESLKAYSALKPESVQHTLVGSKSSKEVKIFIEDGEQELIFSGQIINSPHFKTVLETQKLQNDQAAQFNPFTSNIPEIKEKHSNSKSPDHSFGKDFSKFLDDKTCPSIQDDEEKLELTARRRAEANRFSIKDCLSLPTETKLSDELFETKEKEDPITSARERKSLEMEVINETNSSVIKHFDSILISSPSPIRKGQGVISPINNEEAGTLKATEPSINQFQKEASALKNDSKTQSKSAKKPVQSSSESVVNQQQEQLLQSDPIQQTLGQESSKESETFGAVTSSSQLMTSIPCIKKLESVFNSDSNVRIHTNEDADVDMDGPLSSKDPLSNFKKFFSRCAENPTDQLDRIKDDFKLKDLSENIEQFNKDDSQGESAADPLELEMKPSARDPQEKKSTFQNQPILDQESDPRSKGPHHRAKQVKSTSSQNDAVQSHGSTDGSKDNTIVVTYQSNNRVTPSPEISVRVTTPTNVQLNQSHPAPKHSSHTPKGSGQFSGFSKASKPALPTAGSHKQLQPRVRASSQMSQKDLKQSSFTVSPKEANSSKVFRTNSLDSSGKKKRNASENTPTQKASAKGKTLTISTSPTANSDVKFKTSKSGFLLGSKKKLEIEVSSEYKDSATKGTEESAPGCIKDRLESRFFEENKYSTLYNMYRETAPDKAQLIREVARSSRNSKSELSDQLSHIQGDSKLSMKSPPSNSSSRYLGYNSPTSMSMISSRVDHQNLNYKERFDPVKESIRSNSYYEISEARKGYLSPTRSPAKSPGRSPVKSASHPLLRTKTDN